MLYSLIRFVYIIGFVVSELYEAARWRTDPRLQAPMATLSNGSMVFLGDIVTLDQQCYGKVKKFFTDVSNSTAYS